MRGRTGRSPFERPTRPDQQPAAPATPPAAPPPAAVVLNPEAPPAAVCLQSPFAYLDGAGARHGWLAGQLVTDRMEIVRLIRHGAPLAVAPPASADRAGRSEAEEETP